MADRRQSNYSWKAPWAFQDFMVMRRTMTERYVYKKLGILERHSSYKKPYRYGYTNHRIGEMTYAWPNPPAWPPGGGYPCPPFCSSNPPPPRGGGCVSLAALPTILDCDGGMSQISAICAKGPLSGWVASDPTGGRLSVGMGSTTHLPIFLAPGAVTQETYNTAWVMVTDGVNTVPVTVSLVGCNICCGQVTITPDPDQGTPNRVYWGQYNHWNTNPVCFGPKLYYPDFEMLSFNDRCDTTMLWADLSSTPGVMGVYITATAQTIGGAIRPKITCPGGFTTTCEEWSQVDDLGNYYNISTLCSFDCEENFPPDLYCSDYCDGSNSWASAWDAIENYRTTMTLSCFDADHQGSMCAETPGGSSCPTCSGSGVYVYPGARAWYDSEWDCDPLVCE